MLYKKYIQDVLSTNVGPAPELTATPVDGPSALVLVRQFKLHLILARRCRMVTVSHGGTSRPLLLNAKPDESDRKDESKYYLSIPISKYC